MQIIYDFRTADLCTVRMANIYARRDYTEVVPAYLMVLVSQAQLIFNPTFSVNRRYRFALLYSYGGFNSFILVVSDAVIKTHQDKNEMLNSQIELRLKIFVSICVAT